MGIVLPTGVLPTGGRGRAIAAGLTALALLAAWFGVVAPVWDWYDGRAELLRRQHAAARRMATLIETLPVLKQQAGASLEDGGAYAALLPGATDALAAAALQQRIDAFATAANVRIVSAEILPAVQESDLRIIAIRLTVLTPFRSTIALLAALARSDMPMIVDELQIRGPQVNAGEAADIAVYSSLVVLSYRASKEDAR
jgi:hypothetical protein